MPRRSEIIFCKNEDLLRCAQRLRYEVYCEELKRFSPNADHAQRLIVDHLDRFGCTFLALEQDEPIGSIRVNLSREGHLGNYEQWYQLARSSHFPHETGIATKLVVKKSRRGGPAAINLMSSAARCFTERGGMEAYMDCVGSLIPYYLAIGWVEYGPKFDHPENGPSQPMRLDRKGLDQLTMGPKFPDRVRLYSRDKLLAWRKWRGVGRANNTSDGEGESAHMA